MARVAAIFLLLCTVFLCAAARPLSSYAAEAIPEEETGESALLSETAESAWTEEELIQLDEVQRAVVEMYGAVPGQLATVPLTGDRNGLWETDDGLRYRQEDGTDAVSKWIRIDDDLYYFTLDGYAVSSLQTINSHTYYFHDDHTCAFGPVPIGEDTFFFTPAIGMNHGWVQDEESDARYFLKKDGTAWTGWMDVNGFPTFYFGADGKLCIGWADIDGKSYIFDSDGKRQSGWVGYEGDMYYLGNHDVAAVQKNEWVSMDESAGGDGKRRFLQADGKMAYDVELDITGLTYTFDADGVPHLHVMSGIRNNLPYLLAFLVTTLLIAYADWRKSRFMDRFAAAAVISIMVLLAILRGDSVGYDLRFYVFPLRDFIVDNNAGFITFYKNYPQVEPMYLLMEFVLVKLFRSHRVVMGAIALLINAFVYKGIRNRFDRERSWFAWLAYCLLIHNLTFNIMRQYIAVAILFYLFSEPERLTWKRVILFSALAASFHFAGVIGLLFYLIHLMIENRRLPAAAKVAAAVLLLIIPAVTRVLFSSVLELLSDNGLLPKKYNVFIAGNRDNHSTLVNSLQLMMVIFVLAAILLRLYGRFRSQRSILSLLELALICGVDMMYCIWSNALNIRFQYFFSMQRIDALTGVQDDIVIQDKWRRCVDIVLIGIMFVYWYRYYVIQGPGGVCPYVFFFSE